jgi:hypothetical protein
MYKLSFSKKEGIRAAVRSLFILSLFLTVPWLPGKSLAQGVYSAPEQIYLKNITPLLYEFSQVASEVSASVLPLQSAPPEECSSKFADYRGIVGSLGNQLGSLTPPPRLEAVQEYAMQALNGYSSGLDLYFKACTEEDFGVKESLVSQGGIYLNKSVGAVGKAYDEIENVKASGPAVVRKETAEEITEGNISDKGLAEAAPPVESGVRGEPVNPADPNPPAEPAKTKAQVLEEISMKVQAEMESRGETQSEAPIPYRADNETPPAVQPQEEVSGSEPETPKEEIAVQTTVKEEAPEAPAVEPPAPPPVTPEVKTEETPSEEVSVIDEDNAEAAREVKTEEGTEEPDAKESDEDKIKELNQKIMEQAGTDKLKMVAGETISGESETPQAQVKDEGKGAEQPSGSFNADSSGAGNATPLADDQKVAVLAPGDAAGELKEDGAPVDDVKSWCRERCSTQAELDSCTKNRAMAKDRINDLTNTYSSGTRERGVLDKCMSDWKEGSTYNYEMVISCTQFYCTLSGIEDCKDLSK